MTFSCSFWGSSFEINATSGVISTSSRLDRELRPDPFNLIVIATDRDESVADRNQVSVSLTIYGMQGQWTMHFIAPSNNFPCLFSY